MPGQTRRGDPILGVSIVIMISLVMTTIVGGTAAPRGLHQNWSPLCKLLYKRLPPSVKVATG